ncbi:hypothetical protein [Nocardioides jishulii]|uniref:Uncharacterized protein n=1 Tax=Nocardioides jishulii TaxID=2575440 RepID=A0A4U2YQZ7_9ACTN|nr:hypothetical protein [Nocardioides jishulii]QCX27574.1 hypothetical protein FCL41_08605 [Nocardioides jishulii]TKI62381.1 hypothetical protein FC770_08270 [Nocardioides jishulii]
MTEMNQDSARTEALQRVIERVTSWQETATDGTIHDELDKGLREAGVTLTEAQRDQLVHDISEGREIDVAALATTDEGGPA